MLNTIILATFAGVLTFYHTYKKMRKKRFLLCLSLTVFFNLLQLNASAQENNVNFLLKDNGLITFALAENPVITYSDYAVTVTYSGGTVEYQMSDIQRVTIGEYSEDGVKEPAANSKGNLNFESGTFYLSGFAPGVLVSVYNLNGVLVKSRTIAEDGTLEISTNELSSGIYIIKTSSLTYKFNKR